MKVPISEIKISERFRKELGNLELLMESIRRVGLLHPIGITKDKVLVYGRRRLEAVKRLGWKEIPTIQVDLPSFERRIAELEENLRRKNLTWQEEVIAKKELDDLYREMYGSAKPGERTDLTSSDSEKVWTQQRTANLLGESTSLTSEDIKLALYLERHPILFKYDTKSDAKHTLKALLETEKEGKRELPFLNELVYGDCLDVMSKIPTNSINTVLTDPPFFVPTKHYVSRENWSKKYSDLSVMEGFFDRVFREFERILMWHGHLLVFCDAVSYPIMFKVAYSLFDITRCLVWYKGKNYFSLGKGCWRYSFELILHARNSGAYFLKLDRQDIIEHSVVPHQERLHPAQKPIAPLQDLLGACTPPNGVVLDAFMGAGSTLLACKKLGLNYIGIELDKQYYEIAKDRLNHEEN